MDGKDDGVEGMTDEELERHLVTLDYKGKEFKAEVLAEVRRR